MCLSGGTLFEKIVSKQLKNVNKELKIKIYLDLSNTFWLYHPLVKNVYFQSYKVLKIEKWKWINLYIVICFTFQKPLKLKNPSKTYHSLMAFQNDTNCYFPGQISRMWPKTYFWLWTQCLLLDQD